MSSSYDIVHQASRIFITVSAGADDRVDLLLRGEESLMVHDYNETNNWSVVSATYLYYDEMGQAVDYVDNEYNHYSATSIVLWCELIRNDLPMGIVDAVKASSLGKEKKDDEICAICDMIGTLVCKYSYHEKCIKKWLIRNTLCNDNVFAIIF
ncbi:hypothetical protein L1987_59899 [Smallanthus sonchifolius]|uniref:Uncharacterized protein n=1 Tax=Smallanthus sonchifolius TaxID=185202 RepID=A0ACB9D6K3_9ASTR|nr:hypothetical protein L1987_59899 [Smallanthus sonchifolius]